MKPKITRAWVRLLDVGANPPKVVPLVRVEWVEGVLPRHLEASGDTPVEPDCPCMLEHALRVLEGMRRALGACGLSPEAVLEGGLELPKTP